MTIVNGVIGPFDGEERFLSNFWPAAVVLDGHRYPSVEHAYQAAKSLDFRQRLQIRCLPTPGAAKRAGKTVSMRPDWETVKLFVMEDLLRQKFSRAPLQGLLIGTSPLQLVEVNTWGDVYWGVCRGKGQNHLGRLLMQIREELRASIKPA